ncbi:MAG: hypothetical protein U5R48_12585 [Gammaproteobacteria bacterium]|nr:hypothetical protein [Gammaproteobacteria bacterium]
MLSTIAPSEYGAHTQNWSVVQDPRGFIYVGNGTHVLEYDGARRRPIAMPHNRLALLPALAPDSTIYVGSVAEFGHPAPDAQGALLATVSLLAHLPDSLRPTQDIWDIVATQDGARVDFSERNTIDLGTAQTSRASGSAMISMAQMPSSTGCTASEAKHSRRDFHSGIAVAGGRRPRSRYRGANSAIQWVVTGLVPFDADRLLGRPVGTRGSSSSTSTRAKPLHFPPRSTHGHAPPISTACTACADGTFALGPLTDGLAIIDQEGRRDALGCTPIPGCKTR